MAVHLSRASSQSDLEQNQHIYLPIIRASLTAVSLSFFLTALILYSFDINQLGRMPLLGLAFLVPAILTPIFSWQHSKRSLLIEQLQEEIKQASRQDDITGLLSRRFFYETAHRELQLASRHQYPVSILMLRLEHLEDLNQHLGRLMGDYAFRSCADMLKATLRETDILARFSEDSFVILMPHSSLNEAEMVAKRLKKQINTTPLQLKDQEISLEASVSLSATTEHYKLQKLIDTAEQALVLSREKNEVTSLLVTAS